MFRCRNVSMHAFTRLFTTDLVANDCRVFDWLAAVNKKMIMITMMCVWFVAFVFVLVLPRRPSYRRRADDVFEMCGTFAGFRY